MAGPHRRLLLVRHAKSSWDGGGKDVDRPLSGRGRRDSYALGRLLVERGARPDLVLCSTALRTRQTWAGAEEAGLSAGAVRFEDEIYQAWVPELVSLIRSIPDTVETLVLLGHAPGVPDLVSHLGRREPGSKLWERIDAKFPTAAMATMDVTGGWSQVGKARAELVAYDVARTNPD